MWNPIECGSWDLAVLRHSPAASIAVLWCSAIGVSQPAQWYAAVWGSPFAQRRRSNSSHCIWPQCGQGTKYRRWSLASYSRSIRDNPLIVGVETMNTLRRCAKVVVLASASVTGSVTAKNVGAVNVDVREEIKAVEEELDARGIVGVEIVEGGIGQEMGESFSRMGIAILAAIVIAILTLVLTMRSILNPLIIMVSLPLATIGAFLGLLITGYTLDMSGMMGVLMLVGIVLSNAIVLIALVEQLRKEGVGTYDALVEAGRTRLRPILMTALTTMVAMVPLVLGVGAGTVIAAELAVVVIGGLFSSTVLTLVVIPVIYSLVDGLRQRRRKTA